MYSNTISPVFPEKLTLGIPDLDRQHETYFTMAARLGKAVPDIRRVLDDDEVDAVLDILADLRDYALEHFATEETLMGEADYPELEPHSDEHNKFILDIGQMEAELMNGSAIPVVKVHQFVHDWFEDHIREHDKRFGEFYTNK